MPKPSNIADGMYSTPGPRGLRRPKGAAGEPNCKVLDLGLELNTYAIQNAITFRSCYIEVTVRTMCDLEAIGHPVERRS